MIFCAMRLSRFPAGQLREPDANGPGELAAVDYGSAVAAFDLGVRRRDHWKHNSFVGENWCTCGLRIFFLVNVYC